MLHVFHQINFFKRSRTKNTKRKSKNEGLEGINTQGGNERPHVLGKAGGQARTLLHTGTPCGLSRSRARPDAGVPTAL